MRFLVKAVMPAVFAICFAWSAGAVPIWYQASLSGAAEDPPNDSAGIGSALVMIDTDAHTLLVKFDFANLTGTTTAAHIHGPTLVPFQGNAGVITTTPTFMGAFLGMTSGSFEELFDLTMASSFNPAFVTAQGSVAQAESALAQALAEGKAYLNIHSTFRTAGEIRGFLTPVPLPAGLTLLLGGLLALGWVGRAHRRA